MCLGTIAKVVEVPNAERAVVEHTASDGTVRREDVLKMTIGDQIMPGDWVVIHSGFVLERISASRAHEALDIRSTPHQEVAS
jgi:hydrogenase expression/formation protein HypC